MAKQFVTHIDLAKNELQNAVIQPLASAPSSPVEGQIYYNTTDDTIYVWADGSWLDLGIQGGTGAVDSVNGDTGVVSLGVDNLDDTTIITPAEGDILQYAGDTNKWENRPSSVIIGSASTDDLAEGSSNHYYSTILFEADFATKLIDEDDMSSDSDTAVPTQQSVKAYVDASVVGLLDFKGATDASANPNYPSALKGDAYVISVAGKVGGASGVSVDIGDMIVATADNAGGTQASVGASWRVLEHNLVGAMLASNNLSDVGSAATAYDNIKQAASTTYVGSVELATQAEAQAKTDTTRALTAASVADFTRKASATYGDNSATSFAITHGLGSQWPVVSVYEVSSGNEVEVDVTVTSSTVVTISHAVAPTTNQYRYVIVG